jgi:hypothetical protein
VLLLLLGIGCRRRAMLRLRVVEISLYRLVAMVDKPK